MRSENSEPDQTAVGRETNCSRTVFTPADIMEATVGFSSCVKAGRSKFLHRNSIRQFFRGPRTRRSETAKATSR